VYRERAPGPMVHALAEVVLEIQTRHKRST